MKTLSCLLGLAALASLSLPLQAANLLTNGSFESGTFVNNGNGFDSLAVGSTTIPGWTTVNNEITWQSSTNFVGALSEDGTYCVELTGLHDSLPYGGVTQTVATTVGTNYQVSFYLGFFLGGSSTFVGPVTAIVKAGNQSQIFTADLPSTPTTGSYWKKFTYVFTALSSSTPITFTGLQATGGKTLMLDNIEMSVSPSAPTAPPNLIANGDFEDSSTFVGDTSSSMNMDAGATAIGGWTTFQSQVHWSADTNPFGFRAQSGHYSLDLTGYDDALPYGGLKQTVATITGHTYDVTFYLGSVPNGNTDYRGPVSALLNVGADSQTFSTPNFASTSPTTVWSKFVYHYTATADSTQFFIRGTGSTGGKYIGLDNVSMVDTTGALPPPVFANGDFELGKFVDIGIGAMYLNAGSTVLTGWTTVGGKLAWTKNTNTVGFKSKLGDYSLNLIGPIKTVPYGGVTRTVTTVPNQYYLLTYYLGGMPTGADAGLVGITVHVGNDSITNNYDPTGAPGTTTSWAKFTYLYKAISDSTVITFNGNTATGGYIGLDAITLDSVKIQTVTFPVPATATVGQTITLGATASSGLPITYSISAGTATLVGDKLTFTTAGIVSLVATQPGNPAYASAATVSTPRGTRVSKGTQTIAAFKVIPAKTFGNAPFAITLPTASSGWPVTVKVKSGPATISGSTLTLTGGGAVTLSATQAGNAGYNAAAEVTTSFVVNPAVQTITFPAIGATKVGQTVTLAATSTSGLPITYRLLLGTATLAGNKLTLTTATNVRVEASQAGNASYKAAVAVRQDSKVSAK